MTLNYSANSRRPRLPVTVRRSVLGAGNTALLHEVLQNRKDRRVAVIVNEMREPPIDVARIERGGERLSQTEETLGELTSGRIGLRNPFPELRSAEESA